MSYVNLFICLLICLRASHRHMKTLVLIVGLVNYYQLKYSTDWYNTEHQISEFEVDEEEIIPPVVLENLADFFSIYGVFILFFILILIFFRSGAAKL